MDNLLVAAGIAIIIFILWKDWAKETTLQKEKEDDRKLLGELADARREVQVLLGQLETVSEKIVDEISYGLKEIKTKVSSAIEKRDDREDTGTDSNRKARMFRVLNRLQSGNLSKPNLPNPSSRSKHSGVNVVSLTPGKTAAPVKQRAVINKREQDTLAGKEPHVKEFPPKHQMVYAMADMGHTEEEIAKQMKIGKGEVSLLLQLRRKGEEGNV